MDRTGRRAWCRLLALGATGALLAAAGVTLIVTGAASPHDGVEVLGATAGTWLAVAGLVCAGAAVSVGRRWDAARVARPLGRPAWPGAGLSGRRPAPGPGPRGGQPGLVAVRRRA